MRGAVEKSNIKKTFDGAVEENHGGESWQKGSCREPLRRWQKLMVARRVSEERDGKRAIEVDS